MQEQTTISVKIKKIDRMKLRKLKIIPSVVIRKAIKKEILKREAGKLNKEMARLKKVFKKIPFDEVIESIRHDRESR